MDERKEELMKVTKKLSTITLHQAKVVLTITHENEILDFVLFNRALGNVVTSNQIIYKFWSIDEKYNEKIMEFTSEMMLSLYAHKLSNL